MLKGETAADDEEDEEDEALWDFERSDVWGDFTQLGGNAPMITLADMLPYVTPAPTLGAAEALPKGDKPPTAPKMK